MIPPPSCSTPPAPATPGPSTARRAVSRRAAAYCYRMLGSCTRPRTRSRRRWCARGAASGASTARLRPGVAVQDRDQPVPHRDRAAAPARAAGRRHARHPRDRDQLARALPDSSPEAQYLTRESVELAFVASLQHLTALQRAALILREVLGFSAAETAEQLGTSAASVNSALQRARKAIDSTGPTQQTVLRDLGDAAIEDIVRTGQAPGRPATSTRSWRCSPRTRATRCRRCPSGSAAGTRSAPSWSTARCSHAGVSCPPARTARLRSARTCGNRTPGALPSRRARRPRAAGRAGRRDRRLPRR